MQLHTFSHWPSGVSTLLYSYRERGKFEWSSNRCSTENSTNMATPMDQDDPVGSSVAPSDTPSVSDILRAHKTTSSWKLFTGNHCSTLCHDKGCTLCATYMLHLTQGANARELGPQPEGLEDMLEDAWPGAIGCIHQDASQELERANRTIDRLIWQTHYCWQTNYVCLNMFFYRRL